MAYTPATPLDAVEALYIGYFGRAGEPGGVQYWVNQIQQGRTFAQVAAAFSVQAEAKAQHPFLANPALVSPGDFVESLYSQLFGRASDAAGKAYWVGQLAAANGNPFAYGLIVAQFISGAQNSADGQDLTVIQNKVVAAEYFTQKLAAAGIQGTDANGQVTPATDAAATDALSGVTKDASSIDASKVKTDAFVSGGAGGTTFTFTDQVDNLQGTQGNDTFLGDKSSSSPADTANGGSGTDTIKLFGLDSGFIPQLNSVENVYISGNTAGSTFDVSTKTGVVSLELNASADGTTGKIGAAQSVTVSDLAAGSAVNVTGDASVTTTSLTLSNDGSATANAKVDVSGLTGLKTLNLTSNGTLNNIELVTAGTTTTLNIAGAAKADLDTAALNDAITTIDASKATGGAEVAIGAGAVKYIGGAGVDKVTVQSITSADSIDGGAGTADRLVINAGITKANGAGIKGFEILDVQSAITQDVDALVTNNPFTGIHIGAAGATVNNINDAAINGIQFDTDSVAATTLTGKSFIAGGISDTATLTLTDGEAIGGVDIAALTFDKVDVINFVSKSDGTPGGVGTGEYNSVSALLATDLDVIKVTGDEGMYIQTAATTSSLTVVDASGSTGGLILDANASAIGSLNVLGSTSSGKLAGDTITVNNAATAATVQGNAGGDTITIETTVNDVVKYVAQTDSLVGQTDGINNYDTIIGLTAGDGGLINIAAFGFTASGATVFDRTALAGNVNNTTLAVDASVAANFFVDVGNINRGVVVVDEGAYNAVFIDVNKNGAWDAGADMAIRVDSATVLTAADFIFS